MQQNFFGETTPTFYGATTIGERGQIVIPAEARKDLDLNHSTKVMVFRVGPFGEGLLILKADTVAKMITKANLMLSGMQDFLETEKQNEETQKE
ncbi:MAG: AbrB/MazE/SpoVT family DNA-binding domain-containing protein [Dehalococcoidales bacterium]|nr:AbrB/MazE/SpoVT family DNA-binding domain-containing protein [Dehalococcoidales bacterium]